MIQGEVFGVSFSVDPTSGSDQIYLEALINTKGKHNGFFKVKAIFNEE